MWETRSDQSYYRIHSLCDHPTQQLLLPLYQYSSNQVTLCSICKTDSSCHHLVLNCEFLQTLAQIAYYLNWTELDDDITVFNDELPLTENWVFTIVLLYYWHTIFLFNTVKLLWHRAVVKSTFVESKTSPRPGLSSPSQDRVQRGSSPSQVQVQEVRVQVKSKSKWDSQNRERKK